MKKRAHRTSRCAGLVVVVAAVASHATASAQESPAPAPPPPAQFPPATATAAPEVAPAPAAPPGGAPSPPQPTPLAPSAALGCTKDTDCKGDRVCDAGRCVNPSPVPQPMTRTVEIAPQPGAPAPPQMVVLYTPPPPESVARSGFTFGLRFGVGFPAGQLNAPQTGNALQPPSTGDASDAFGVMFPVTFDVGYRATPHWLFNGYFGVGYATGANCASNGTDVSSCSETVYRFGGEVEYRILPSAFFQPWVAAGLGWEVANQFDSDEGDADSTFSASGFEFLHLSGGLDLHVFDRVRAGPYFEASFTEYEKVTSSNLNGYVHEWFIAGIRASYDTNLLHR